MVLASGSLRICGCRLLGRRHTSNHSFCAQGRRIDCRRIRHGSLHAVSLTSCTSSSCYSSCSPSINRADVQAAATRAAGSKLNFHVVLQLCPGCLRPLSMMLSRIRAESNFARARAVCLPGSLSSFRSSFKLNSCTPSRRLPFAAGLGSLQPPESAQKHRL